MSASLRETLPHAENAEYAEGDTSSVQVCKFASVQAGGGRDCSDCSIVRIVRLPGNLFFVGCFGVFSPPNTRKPASRDTEGSLKNHPSDPALAILPHYIRAKGRWVCGAKISNRLPRPAEPVSEFSVV